jgi:hypothetical protein
MGSRSRSEIGAIETIPMILLDIIEAGMLLLMAVVAVLFIGWLGYSLLDILGVFEWWESWWL